MSARLLIALVASVNALLSGAAVANAGVTGYWLAATFAVAFVVPFVVLSIFDANDPDA